MAKSYSNLSYKIEVSEGTMELWQFIVCPIISVNYFPFFLHAHAKLYRNSFVSLTSSVAALPP